MRDALKAFRQTSLFLCDIGSINGESSVLQVKSISKSQIQQLAHAGAVGDINSYFFYAEFRTAGIIFVCGFKDLPCPAAFSHSFPSPCSVFPPDQASPLSWANEKTRMRRQSRPG